MRSIVKALRTFILAVIIVVAIPIGIFIFFVAREGYGRVYITSSLTDYKQIRGNFDNETPTDFINSFFPDTIEDTFSDAVFYYKAKKMDTYAFECYLEFVIEDIEEYSDFLGKSLNEQECSIFRYDPSYMEYNISNILFLNSDSGHYGVFMVN